MTSSEIVEVVHNQRATAKHAKIGLQRATASKHALQLNSQLNMQKLYSQRATAFEHATGVD